MGGAGNQTMEPSRRHSWINRRPSGATAEDDAAAAARRPEVPPGAIHPGDRPKQRAGIRDEDRSKRMAGRQGQQVKEHCGDQGGDEENSDAQLPLKAYLLEPGPPFVQ